MRASLIIAGAITIAPVIGLAQPYWRAMGRGTIGPTEVQTLYGDSIMDLLLAGGTYMRIVNDVDTALVMGQSAWNGSRWDSIAHRIQPISGNNSTQQTHWFLRYQGSLYACGNFPLQTPSGEWSFGMARLNEGTDQWEALECLNPSWSGLAQLVPKEPQGGSIYAAGFTGSLCSFPEACVYRNDGNAFFEWEPWAQIPPDPDNYVGYVFDFQGMTYVTGGFRDPNGPGIVYFMRLNGTSWEPVPGWPSNAPGIKDILIRNNTLYVAGFFKQSTGAPGNRIASFDGTSWDDMGGGVSWSEVPNTGTVWSLWWHHDKLFVGGLFDEVAGTWVNSGLAAWDGAQWHGMPGAFWSPSNPDGAQILDITTWHDSLFICGGFREIDGESIPQVAQYIGGDEDLIPMGVGEIQSPPALTLTPNPTSGALSLVGLPPRSASFSIFDVLGGLVRRGQITRPQFDVSDLRVGSYFVVVQDPNGKRIAAARFMKY